MYRQVFTPTEHNNTLPFVNIPREWYGLQVEMIVFPITHREKTDTEKKEEQIVRLCGAWKSQKSAEEIITDIYSSRTSGKTHVLENL